MFSQYAVSRLAAVRSLLCDFETETSSHLDVHCNTTVSKSICRAATQWTEKKVKKKKLTNDDNYKPVFHVRGEPSCLIGLAKKRSHFVDYLQWLLHFLAICDPSRLTDCSTTMTNSVRGLQSIGYLYIMMMGSLVSSE